MRCVCMRTCIFLALGGACVVWGAPNMSICIVYLRRDLLPPRICQSTSLKHVGKERLSRRSSQLQVRRERLTVMSRLSRDFICLYCACHTESLLLPEA